MFDVSPLVPEARTIAQKAAEVYWQHTRLWFVGLLVHGSALKGGFIPNCSDIDMQLFLTLDAFEEDGYLPLSLSVDIQRELAKIDPTPFQYIQCYALPNRPTKKGKGSLGPAAGTYHMLAGELPVAEADKDDLLNQAHHFLANLPEDPVHARSALLQHGGGKLERIVRLICTDVGPALYHIVALETDDPLRVWTLPKRRVITLLESDGLGRSVDQFYQAVSAYYLTIKSTEKALNVIQSGNSVLGLIKEHYTCSLR